MRALIVCSVLLFSVLGGNAQVNPEKALKEQSVKESKGIDFFKGTFQEAMAESAKTGKPIFMDAYAEWCGPCKLMDKKVFSQSKAGEFFNANFINIKMDMEKGEGVDLSKKLGVKAYPTFFILNSEGTVKVNALGYMDVDRLIEFGKSGL